MSQQHADMINGNGKDQISSEDEFVVPHMDSYCLTNSLAYQKVLEQPWTYLHNWSNLNLNDRNSILQQFLTELNDLRTNLAVPISDCNLYKQETEKEESDPEKPTA